MLGKKLLILVMVLIAMVGTASAAITLTVNTPTENQQYRPNMDGTEYIDINVTYVDSVATNSVHELAITFAIGDTNRWLTSDSNALNGSANDQNMSSANCTFAVDNVWTTPGADCIVRYTLPTSPQLGTGNYILDINGTGYNLDGEATASGLSIRKFSIDNRWVDTSVEALLNIIPVVLIAAVLVGVILAGFGMIGGRTLIIIVVGAIVSIIAVVVMTGIMGILTP